MNDENQAKTSINLHEIILNKIYNYQLNGNERPNRLILSEDVYIKLIEECSKHYDTTYYQLMNLNKYMGLKIATFKNSSEYNIIEVAYIKLD